MASGYPGRRTRARPRGYNRPHGAPSVAMAPAENGHPLAARGRADVVALLWRTTPVHRSEDAGPAGRGRSAELPDGVPRDDVQHPPAAARAHCSTASTAARIREARLGAEELIATVSADPDRVAPTELATFRKVTGERGRMTVGDEFVVRMPAPGTARSGVIHRTPTSFRFVTLEGHLESGQIQWAARDGELLEFTIESWARSGDRLSNVFFDHLR